MTTIQADHPAQRESRRHVPSLSWQAISFAAVGASGTIISFILLTLLHKGLGWHIVLANSIAYGAGIVNNYLWNRRWTFRHVERRSMLHQGGQFALISIVGLVVHTTILSLGPRDGLRYYATFAIATLVAYCWNFAANHQVTFRHRAESTLHAIAHPHLSHHAHAEASAVISDGD